MKKCLNCEKELDDNIIFCGNCGAKQENIELICPICKEPFKIGQKRCKKCKTILPKTYRKLPDEYKKFNWAAFLDPMLWSLVHKDYRLFIWLCIPIANIFLIIFMFFVALYYGFKGNEIGWQKFESNDIKLYDNIQRDWAKAHALWVGLFVIIWLFTAIPAIFLMTPQIKENDRIGKEIITNYNAKNFEYICSGSIDCVNQIMPVYNNAGEITKLKFKKSSYKTTKYPEAGEAKRVICYRAFCPKHNSKCEVCIETRDYNSRTYIKEFIVKIEKKKK